ncbi:hypothetical protein BDV98DRAFT_247058 [Pterulicium gracile]|uniref:Uncharacterized protein n=1 Tax=Pterulicium gracile TaxID=1884261 RepID=A0A5C3Q813_9AGAR|nr:hypothetical protein BDV98DRAFT_247058 [Pterula gracilis]
MTAAYTIFAYSKRWRNVLRGFSRSPGGLTCYSTVVHRGERGCRGTLEAPCPYTLTGHTVLSAITHFLTIPNPPPVRFMASPAPNPSTEPSTSLKTSQNAAASPFEVSSPAAPIGGYLAQKGGGDPEDGPTPVVGSPTM